jgi:hypothetical protein
VAASSVASDGFLSGLSCPRWTESGRENEYLPSRLMWSNTRGERRARSFRLYGETFSSKLLQGCIDIERVPKHNNVEDEPKCSELVLLPLPIALVVVRDVCRGKQLAQVCGGLLLDSAG